MKKALFVCSIFLLLTTVLPAQTGLRLGLKFSPTLSKVVLTDSAGAEVEGVESSYRSSLSMAIVATYGIGNHLVFGTGLGVSDLKGDTFREFKIPQTNEKVTQQTLESKNSVEVPVYVKLRTNEIGTGIFIYAQGAIIAEFNGTYTYEFVETTYFDEVNPSVTSVLSGEVDDLAEKRSFTLATTIGLDKQFEFGLMSFGISYGRGLSDFRTSQNSPDGYHARVEYLQLNLAYYF